MVKSPSFTDLKPASAASSRAKRHNRRTDTQHEKMLRHELWRLGLRYRKNVKTLPGRPDIVFVRARVAVFCDGDFWHGRNWDEQKSKLRQGANAEYWLSKIESNIARDKKNTALLEANGWCVLRLWETDITQAPRAAAEQVKEVVWGVMKYLSEKAGRGRIR